MEIKFENQELKNAMELICRSVKHAGGRAYIVGGCIRDAILGFTCKDLDFEIFELKPEFIFSLLAANFSVDLVGEAFGVIKIHNLPIDVSLPRLETKYGTGHRGFKIFSDPELTLEQAAARRDFTINSIYYDPMTCEIFDPFNGEKDLKQKILRHTSEKFSEDPLRVLRAMQLIARFQLTAAQETIEICRNMDMEGLAPERIFEEWRKLLHKGIKPSLGLEFLRDCMWIRFFPELQALVGCRQDDEWHPEGDVFVHTLQSMDAFAQEKISDEWEDLVVGFAVLCHDFGKPATTKFEDGRLRSKRHEEEGEKPARAFLSRMVQHKDLVKQIIPLVTNHLKPQELYDSRAGDSAIRRLARRVGRIDRLVRVARADQLGRPPELFDGFPAGEWLLKRSEELEIQDSIPKPIIMGRHLIELGLEPGKHFGRILKECYEAQLDGKFTDITQGITFLKELLNKHLK